MKQSDKEILRADIKDLKELFLHSGHSKTHSVIRKLVGIVEALVEAQHDHGWKEEGPKRQMIMSVKAIHLERTPMGPHSYLLHIKPTHGYLGYPEVTYGLEEEQVEMMDEGDRYYRLKPGEQHEK